MRADWLGVEEARGRILADLQPLPAETVALDRALGRVLAEEIRSPLALPPWDNSAMDGFAVRAEDVRGASQAEPRELPVAGDVPAGSFPERALEPGTAVRVMTGAPVPEGADSVVRVEHTDGGRGIGTPQGRVRVHADSDAGRNIRRRGEDLRAGERVLEPGRALRAAEIGVAASLGRASLRVVRRPMVALLASGDELVDLDGFSEVLAGRRIVSSNTYSLRAQLAESGMEARVLGIAADRPDSLRAHLEAARGCDALVTTAGVSVGEHDHQREVLLEMGLDARFWRVRMRPGSPFGYGRVGALGGIPWFGLPGNPVSCMVTFEVFVRPALLRLAGHQRVLPRPVEAEMAEDYLPGAGLTQFPRARLEWRPDAPPLARLTGPQGSGILSSMAAADALLVVPEQADGVRAGETVRAIPLGAGPLLQRE